MPRKGRSKKERISQELVNTSEDDLDVSVASVNKDSSLPKDTNKAKKHSASGHLSDPNYESDTGEVSQRKRKAKVDRKRKTEESVEETSAELLVDNRIVQISVSQPEERDADFVMLQNEDSDDEEIAFKTDDPVNPQVFEEQMEVEQVLPNERNQQTGVKVVVPSNERNGGINQKSVEDLDAEMKRKIQELHGLMTQGGLTESASMLSKCLPMVEKEGKNVKQGVNTNMNATGKRKQNAVITDRNIFPSQSNNAMSLIRSEDTVYDSAVPKHNSSSSEEGLINTSDEIEMRDNEIEDFIADIRQNQSMRTTQNDRFHYTRPGMVEQNTVNQRIEQMPSTSDGRRGSNVQHSQQIAADEQAQQMIREAELAKARIFATSGKNDCTNEKFGNVQNSNDPQVQVQRWVSSSAMLDEGYIVVSAHLDQLTIDKIQRGEYIDFGKLIPKDRMMVEDDGRLEMVIKNGKTYWLPVCPSVNITNFGKWEQAFRVFSNIYCKFNPDRAAELIEYNHVIHTISLAYIWDNVYAYDKDFRMHMARNTQRNWSMILQQAWSLRLRDRTAAGQGYGPVNPNWNRNKTNEACRRFNHGKCNFGANCKFEHKCNYCNRKGHPAVHCRKAIADRNGQNSSVGHEPKNFGNPQYHSPSVGRNASQVKQEPAKVAAMSEK